MNNFTLTVTKFNSIIKDIFNAEELLHNIKIVGEVFGISKAHGVAYFSIKDEESSLPCVCFIADMLQNVKEGDQVVLTGSPNFYVKGGRFNFVVNRLEQSGQGLLFQKFIELKEKLEREGLFDVVHKKPIPSSIKRIGVVTSRDGAVIQDIKNVAWRRNPSIDIVLYHTKVQGIGAEKEIADGINFFSTYNKVDVVVVARGGGSLEDLSAYNTEIVARATYDCQKPIVSAVGHETDFTIIDFVSDLRAPTPSAAAELLTQDSKNLQASLKKDVARLARLLDVYVSEKTLQFAGSKNIILDLIETFLKERVEKLKKITSHISTKLTTFTLDREYQLKLKIASLNKLNPLDILRMGYAKIEQQGKTVGRKTELNISQEFDINFIDGNVTIKTGERK